MKIYIVQLGDSLYKIAQKHGVSLDDLKKLNTQLTDPDNIKPGMKIKVPSDSKYVKKKVKADKIIKESPKKEMIKKMPSKENAIKENPVKENVTEKPKITEVKKKEPGKKKLKELTKKDVKPEKKSAEKEKTVKQLEENIVPTQSANNEPLKPMKAKEEPILPMMEDPYPNAITPKKTDLIHEGKGKLPDAEMGIPSYFASGSSNVYEQGQQAYFHQQPFNNQSQSGKMKTLNQDSQPHYPFADGSQAHYYQEQQGFGEGGYNYPNIQPSHPQQGVGYGYQGVQPQMSSSQQGMVPSSYGYPNIQPSHPQQGVGYGYQGAQPQMPSSQQGMMPSNYGYPSMQPSHPQQGMMHGGYGYPGTQGFMQGSDEQSFQDAMPASQPTPQMPPPMGASGQISGAYGYPMSQVGQGHFSTLQAPPGLTELPHRDENPYSLWESYHNTMNIPAFPKNEDQE